MIQALLDLIMHIISDEGWGVHLQGVSIADLLVKKKVITTKERDSLIKIHGFRNRLVHEYEVLDLRIAYDILTGRKDETRALLNTILKFIGY
jgi:uncharacterized protein YutE (UPF0331/DUF86 family)